MSAQFEISAEKLAWRCDLSFLPFTCTAEMTPLEDFIGQERAIRAIEFGLGVNKPGFNIFVTGLTGTGKTSIIKAFLKKITSHHPGSIADAAVPEDCCYVYNFSDADRPQALKIRRGWGKLLKMDMQIGPAITILRFGTEEQRQNFIPALVSGRKIGCFAITEADAGSDVAGMRVSHLRRRTRKSPSPEKVLLMLR